MLSLGTEVRRAVSGVGVNSHHGIGSLRHVVRIGAVLGEIKQVLAVRAVREFDRERKGAGRQVQAMAAVLPCHAPGAIVSQLGAIPLIIARGGGLGGNPPSGARPYLYEYYSQPPVGVVVGAGAAGALTGHLVFRSLLASVGLGVGAMGLAASADDRAGEVARASGRFVLAAFHQAAELNDRYDLTTKMEDFTRTAAHRIREFDEKNSVMHRATEGAKQAWRDLKQYDDTHGLTAKAGNALSLGLDRLSAALSPPADETWTIPGHNRARGDAAYGRRKGGSGGETRRRGKRVDSNFGRGDNRYGRGRSGGNSDRRYDRMKAYARNGSSSRESYRRESVLGRYGKDGFDNDHDQVDDDWWSVDDDTDSFWRQ